MLEHIKMLRARSVLSRTDNIRFALHIFRARPLSSFPALPDLHPCLPGSGDKESRSTAEIHYSTKKPSDQCRNRKRNQAKRAWRHAEQRIVRFFGGLRSGCAASLSRAAYRRPSETKKGRSEAGGPCVPPSSPLPGREAFEKPPVCHAFRLCPSAGAATDSRAASRPASRKMSRRHNARLKNPLRFADFSSAIYGLSADC